MDKNVLEKLKTAFNAITFYPTETNFTQKERAKRIIITYYKKGDPELKGFILSLINERLSNVNKFRMFFTMDKHPPAHVIKEITDYQNSIDGIQEFLELLIKLDDNLAVKTLTFHITRYLALHSQVTDLLASYGIYLLSKSRNPYSFHFLLSLLESGELKNEIMINVYYSIIAWLEKIDKIKMGKREKIALKRKAKRLISIEELGLTYYG